MTESSSSENLMRPGAEVQNIDLEIASVDVEHFQAVKTLLLTFFKTPRWADLCFEMADRICQTPESFDVAVQDDNVLGVCGFAPLTLFSDSAFITEMLGQTTFITAANLQRMRIGVVFSMKYVNLPADVAVKALNSLVQNQEWTQSNKYNDSVLPAQFFAVTHYLLFSKCKAGQNGRADLETIYNVEMYEFRDAAEKVMFSPKGGFDSEYQFNVFMLVEKTAFAKVVKDLQ